MALFALALAAFGCGPGERSPDATSPAPSAEEAPPAPSAPSPEAAPPAPPAPEPVAEVPEWEGELPADFPADVPRYPGAKVTSARGTGELGMVVTFDSPDAVDVVAKFYTDGLAAQGWQAQSQDSPEGTMIVADKENRRANAVVHPGGQGTLVELILVTVE